MIDSHCHLADAVFRDDLPAVVERAKAAGLERALVILEAGHAEEAKQAERLAYLWPDVRFAIGIHPHMAHEFGAGDDTVADIVRRQILATPLTRALGEIGLDYFYDHSAKDVQRRVFLAQIELALELDLPVVIHTRNADADTLAILRGTGRGSLRGVLHCFTGTADLARAGLDLGLYVSLAGILTFPKAGDLRETARRLPIDRLLVETDSPFLAPVPVRGRRNEPAHVEHVVSALAALHGIEPAEVRRRTTENFHTLFRP